MVSGEKYNIRCSLRARGPCDLVPRGQRGAVQGQAYPRSCPFRLEHDNQWHGDKELDIEPNHSIFGIQFCMGSWVLEPDGLVNRCDFWQVQAWHDMELHGYGQFHL